MLPPLIVPCADEVYRLVLALFQLFPPLPPSPHLTVLHPLFLGLATFHLLVLFQMPLLIPTFHLIALPPLPSTRLRFLLPLTSTNVLLLHLPPQKSLTAHLPMLMSMDVLSFHLPPLMSLTAHLPPSRLPPFHNVSLLLARLRR